ncbi:hypothetical protein C7M84_002712 [Penaeus vannamei]|uniref:Uncharacterized protein n=1 Tax=Penaeus vannamei TaxID=6689 RepID=A0A423TQ20_PENVA|nr:hypothetical protein C7M84_002712 [Penaeus vannamei]
MSQRAIYSVSCLRTSPRLVTIVARSGPPEGACPCSTTPPSRETAIAFFDLKQRLILRHFLKKHGTESGLPRLETLGIRTLKEAVYMVDAFPLEFNDDKDDSLNSLLQRLPRDKKEMEVLSDELWSEIASLYNLPSSRGWGIAYGKYQEF